MKSGTLISTATMALSWLVAASASAQTPLGAEWTYQGKLDLSGSPLNDTADFEFTLWDEAGAGDPPVGGTQIGSTVAVSNVAVVDGLFTVTLDFGAAAFNGEKRWLEIAVASPSGGALTTLSPRQPLTAAPYALQTRGIHVSDSGNVGVGTVSPEEFLHVSGGDLALDHAGAANTTRSIHLLGSRQGAGGPFATIDFSNFDPDGAQEDQPVARIASFNSDLTDSGDLRFFTVEDYGLYESSLERMRITETGNVGIGTFSPTTKLDVFGTVTATSFVGDGSGLTNLPTLWNESGADIYYDAGNVGIGTAVPRGLLEVNTSEVMQNAHEAISKPGHLWTLYNSAC